MRCGFQKDGHRCLLSAGHEGEHDLESILSVPPERDTVGMLVDYMIGRSPSVEHQAVLGKVVDQPIDVRVIVGEVDGVDFADITVPGKGCLEVRLDGAIAGLRAMYVAPEFRRQGIGTALFRSAVYAARVREKVALNWTVRKTNTDALAFYLKQGAARCYEDPLDWWMSVNFEGAGK